MMKDDGIEADSVRRKFGELHDRVLLFRTRWQELPSVIKCSPLDQTKELEKKLNRLVLFPTR